MFQKLRKGKTCLFDNGNKPSTCRTCYSYTTVKTALGGCTDQQVLCSCRIPCSVVFIKEVNVDLKNRFDVQDITEQQLHSLQRESIIQVSQETVQTPHKSKNTGTVETSPPTACAMLAFWRLSLQFWYLGPVTWHGV